MDNEQSDLEKLDKVFPHLHDVGKFSLELCIPTDIEFKDDVFSYPPVLKVSRLLTKYGYATVSEYPDYLAELTPKGQDAKKAGGHFAYLKKVADDEHHEKEISKYDFLQKKFIYKSRYLPYIISAGALIVSILAYFKPTDKQAEEKSKTTQTKDTTQQLTKPKSLLLADTTLKTKDTLRNQ